MSVTVIPRGPFTGTSYQPQHEVYFDDGREIALLHFIYNHPNLASLRNNPQKILDAIDEYATTKAYLMNIGSQKVTIVTDIIAELKPRVIVELGGYCGYSTIAFAAALRETCGKGAMLYSLEFNAEFGAVIWSLVELAGLRDFVTMEIGTSSRGLRRLHAEGVIEKIDLLFLDHVKPLYTPDLKLCEELGLIGPGSVLAADNVVKPGNPPYLKYVRSTVDEKRAQYKEATGLDPANALAARKGHEYKTGDGGQVDESDVHGNPNLIYVTTHHEGWEPSAVEDAVEVSRCTGVAGP